MVNIFSPAFFLVNGVCLVILVFSFRRPLQAAKVIGGIFLFTALLNLIMLIGRPEAYKSLSAVAVFDWYVDAIDSFFQSYLQIIVVTVTIAQVFIGLGLFRGGHLLTTALSGALVFFGAVTPLGAGSLFPAPLILAAACLVVLLKTTRRHGAI